MVDKDAGQLRADRLGQQRRRDRRVDAAGQRQQHLTIADLLADLLDGGFEVVAHRPVARRAADLIEEVADHLKAVFGVVHFRVVLDAVEPPLFIGNRDVGAGGRVGGQGKPLRHLRHVVPVAHPGNALLGEALEEFAAGVEPGLGLAVFAGGIVLGLGDLAAEGVGHQLAAVTDAEDRHPHLEDAGVVVGGGFEVDAVGAAGEDDADRVFRLQLFQRGGIGEHFAVDVAFPHPSRDQLVILAAEVQHNDFLIFHVNILSRLEPDNFSHPYYRIKRGKSKAVGKNSADCPVSLGDGIDRLARCSDIIKDCLTA